MSRYGAHELTHEENATPWALFFNHFKNGLIVILIVANLLPAFVGEYVDAAIILAIVVFCAVLGFVEEYRAERALDASMFFAALRAPGRRPDSGPQQVIAVPVASGYDCSQLRNRNLIITY